MNKTLIDLLRCPISFQSLRRARTDELDAINRAIADGIFRDSPGLAERATFASALITLDGNHAYPVVDDIPVMLAERAVETGLVRNFPRTAVAQV